MSNDLKMSDTLLVGWEAGSKESDVPILIVGRKLPGSDVDVVNAFQGQEALELYSKLAKKGARI